MKKFYLVIALFCLASIAAFAQDNKWGVGLNIGYGTDVSTAFLGAKAEYNINEAFTVAASFNHYFKKTIDGEDYNAPGAEADLKCWDLNLDFHWNVYRSDLIKFYPLIGLTYLHAKATNEMSNITVSASDGKFGANIGAGVRFDIAANWAIAAEAKYQIIDGSQFVPMATIMYRF